MSGAVCRRRLCFSYTLYEWSTRTDSLVSRLTHIETKWSTTLRLCVTRTRDTLAIQVRWGHWNHWSRQRPNRGLQIQCPHLPPQSPSLCLCRAVHGRSTRIRAISRVRGFWSHYLSGSVLGTRHPNQESGRRSSLREGNGIRAPELLTRG